MEPRRILMTGASGFVGRHLVPLLKAAFPAAEMISGHVDISDQMLFRSLCATRSRMPASILRRPP